MNNYEFQKKMLEKLQEMADSLDKIVHTQNALLQLALKTEIEAQQADGYVEDEDFDEF